MKKTSFWGKMPFGGRPICVIARPVLFAVSMQIVGIAGLGQSLFDAGTKPSVSRQVR